MLVVKVELWPFGDANKAEVLGIVAIANQAVTHEDGMTQYQVQLQKPDGKRRSKTVWHYRPHGWMRLVAKALRELE